MRDPVPSRRHRVGHDRYDRHGGFDDAYDEYDEYDRSDDGYGEFVDFDELDDAGRGDYVRIPRRAPELPGYFTVRLVVWGVVLLVVALTGRWGYHQVNPAGEPGESLQVDVAPGSTIGQVSEVLAQAGVVSNARLFQEYARFKGGSGVDAGSYTMARDMALWEALDVLKAGPAPETSSDLTVPEGLRLTEMAAVIVEAVPRLSTEAVLAAMRSGKVSSAYLPPDGNLEGLLFPDTYRVAESASALDILGQMAAQFDSVAAELDLDRRASALGLTPYQVLVIASMIEEEAKVPDERAKISRVIYNRLAEDMPLGIDATTLYAVGKQGNTLTKTDLASDSPYNTRKVAGLPPGPISAPGRASLEAALAPAPGDWLYYVLADASGRHAFTADPDEFDRLVDEADAKGLLG
jgi:UPF0755 protein